MMKTIRVVASVNTERVLIDDFESWAQLGQYVAGDEVALGEMRVARQDERIDTCVA
jgi:hypothetical protein